MSVSQSDSLTHVADDTMDSETAGPPKSRIRIVVSAVCLLLMVVVWVAQNEIAQITEQSNGSEGGNGTGTESCNQPLVIVWFNHILLIVFLPIGLLVRQHCNGGPKRLPGQTVPSMWQAMKDFLEAQGNSAKVWWSTALLTVVYNSANFAWYYGAPLTTISVANAIFNTQVIFTALFGICILRERFGWWQFCSIVVMLGGVFCVTFWTRDGEFTFPEFIDSFGSFSGPVIGDMLMLLSAVLFGLYEVVYKKLASTDESVSTSFIFIGIIGLWDLVLFVWCPIISNFFVTPIGPLFMSSCTWGFMVQAVLSAVFNSLFMVCIYLTSPTVVAITWVLDIPLAFLVDAVFRGEYYCVWQVVGGLLVGVGFVIFVLPVDAIRRLCVRLRATHGTEPGGVKYGLVDDGPPEQALPARAVTEAEVA